MEDIKLNCKQLETSLSQRIEALYLAQLGHQPSQIFCQLNNNKLTIIVEKSVTKPVQFLIESGKQEVAEVLHSNVQKALQPQLKSLIEEVVGVGVVDLFDNSELNTSRTIIIAILAAVPKIDNS